ncbi:MAG: hypothetical protein HOJ85_00280 [Ilumatobacter sp.]|jgi:hypothetical protein|uniref:hypothetical protein n=1 Tax=Ilumatobacter sp. TaxID=1967498 RepID=UPI001D685D7A|nr:hypothetical protein [Ilumatobacter sp.]MBT5277835.1 hypothetical protein [Ilumatobacter sp.]MBT5552188.1 hypothetical protein [Ilumatobacter sp.]MBT5864502.1 hypothetical protein [Ilumatobacter sp.]MBT7429300.1 hypothetical protein [Ilumatobacter sp.]
MSSSAGRSILASVVGWMIVAFIVWVFFGSILGAIGFIIRMVLFLIVVGALLTVYFRLRDGD